MDREKKNTAGNVKTRFSKLDTMRKSSLTVGMVLADSVSGSLHCSFLFVRDEDTDTDSGYCYHLD